MFHPSRIFAFLLFIFLISIVCFSLNPWHISFFIPVLVTIVVLVICFWRHEKIRIILLAALFILTAAWRVSIFQNQIKPQSSGKEIVIIGVIIEESKTSGRIQQLLIKREGRQEKFAVVTNQFPEYAYGEKIEIKGKISKVAEDNEYMGYYKSKNISGSIVFPKIEKVGVGDGRYVRLRRGLIRFRKGLEEKIAKGISEPEAGLLSGILFGSKAAITDEFSTALSRTGTFHIVALSGFNITIVAEFLRLLTKRYSKRLSFLLPMVGVWIFVLATGLSASVIRAAIMGSLLIVAGFVGRKSDALVAILFASAAMVFLNPTILLWDIGFQLSFAATVGILFLAPLIEKYFSVFGVFGTYVSATVAAQILTWPITSYYFGNVSLIAPVANAFILPFIPPVMLLGLVTSLSAYISAWLSHILAIISWSVLAYFSKVINIFARFSFTSLDYKLVSAPIIIGYYLLLFDFLMILKRRKIAKKTF